ncbi:MAG: sulfatase-like hydrolase/transferase [Phycisphaeraceae bacterium]|nr:sulfatase-like hydrolase/transferase [Phycisphaeraceae bacterium]
MTPPAAPGSRPNVIIFFTDQQRWDSSGLHGNPLELMPNFDRLARAGTHVAKSFTCQPVCGPARACLQTGTYATTNGCWRNGIGLPRDRDRFPTLASCFNEAGYRTGYIGKWHLGGVDGRAAEDRGPVKDGYRGDYQDWLAVEALEFSVDEYHTTLYDEDNQPIHLPGYRTDACTDAAIRYVDRHRTNPFFLMVSYIEPHHQNDKDDYPPPIGYRERYAGRWTPPDLAALPQWQWHEDRAHGSPMRIGGTAQQHLGGYWGMVKRLDEALGRLVDALITLNMLDNTIILFTSDHGCHFKTRNGEYKRSCHESSIRVPTMLHGGPFTGGGELPQLASLLDLPPTLLDACGIAIPASMQGRSILPLVRGDLEARRPWPEEVFVQISESQIGRCVRTQRWKYSVRDAPDAQIADGAADRYVEEYLYDLHYDPYELCNLVSFDSHAQVRAIMRDRLLRRMKEAGESAATVDPSPLPAIRGGQRTVSEAEARA